MRLFAYYVFHSVLNTLKKLLKTWVAVFLVLCVAGGLLGCIIGTVISFVEDQNEAKVESVEEEDDDNAQEEKYTCTEKEEHSSFCSERLFEVCLGREV
jgi:predicted PurR-regulated permease PerM